MRKKAFANTSALESVISRFKERVRKDMSDKMRDMYDGRTATPYKRTIPAIRSAKEYRQRLSAYKRRLQRELAEFNSALIKISVVKKILIYSTSQALRMRKERAVRLLLYHTRLNGTAAC